MTRSVAVCLVSGGMDSAVCAAIAARDYTPAFLHCNYGQRTEQKELAAFHALADHYEAKARLVVDFQHLKIIGGTSLLSDGPPVPTGTTPGGGIPSTYVPFRNGLLLSTAAAWGEVLSAKRIFFGAVEQDSSGYPDCREEFIAAMSDAIQKGTKPDTDLKIEAPLVRLSKGAIVKRGLELSVPFHLTWSCYTGNDRACGVCESCHLRLKGFAEAGAKDPIPYVP
ncbi:MAG: 7-cyano-7-deazaguanine synthase QueC [Deltaproteobacteria bacterium]|nr:7-cyano-7-deazaguanine synthase QueC [Deltaproteobacteria bacterium]